MANHTCIALNRIYGPQYFKQILQFHFKVFELTMTLFFVDNKVLYFPSIYSGVGTVAAVAALAATLFRP